MRKLFDKTEKGFLPDYTNDGVTIKKNWETLSREADQKIVTILNDLIEGRSTLEKAIEDYHKIPFEVEDCDISKETNNPFIDFLIDFSQKSEDEVVDLYHKIYDKVFSVFE